MPSGARGLTACIVAIAAALVVIVGLTASVNDVSAVESPGQPVGPTAGVVIEVPPAPPLSVGEPSVSPNVVLARLHGAAATRAVVTESEPGSGAFHERLVRAKPTAKPTVEPTVLPATSDVVVVTGVGPVSPVGSGASQPDIASYEQRGRAALALVPYDPGALGYTVSFHPWRPGPRGLTHNDRRHIEIFVEPAMPEHLLVHVIAHEIGHAVDLVLNSQADEDRWREQRGIPASTPWWPGPAASDFASPAGDFAECFASWLVGATSRSSIGNCAAMAPLMAELAKS